MEVDPPGATSRNGIRFFLRGRAKNPMVPHSGNVAGGWCMAENDIVTKVQLEPKDECIDGAAGNCRHVRFLFFFGGEGFKEFPFLKCGV